MTASTPDLRARPYRDLARAALAYNRSGGDVASTHAYLAALKAVRRLEHPSPASFTRLDGLWVHILTPPAQPEDADFIARDEAEAVGPAIWNAVVERFLEAPRARVWADCTAVDLHLFNLRMPPSVRLLHDLLAEGGKIDELKIDSFFERVGPLAKDEADVRQAALLMLQHVGKEARLICWS